MTPALATRRRELLDAHREESLTAAARTRSIRRRTRDDLAELDHQQGRDEVAEMLEHGVPAGLGSLHVRRMLKWVHYLGDYRIQEMLNDAGVPWDEHLRSLTENQRWRLADVLRGVDE